MIGREHRKNPHLKLLERIYISIFGYPALGLHIRAKAILPLLKRIENPASILDAGCGNGAFAFAMAKTFPKASVTGIDTDITLIQNNAYIAENLGISNCCFICMNVFDVSPEKKYDLILSTDNIEHVDNDNLLLELFYNAIKPGGSLILHTPHINRHVFWWKRQNFMEIGGHVRPGYRKITLEKMLLRNNFKIHTSEYNYNSFETLFNDISYLITLGREKRRALYALLFPWLLLLSKAFHWWPVGTGSGLVIHARK